MSDHPVLSRRVLLGGVAATLGTSSVAAQIAPSEETVPLWPGAIPGAGGERIVRRVDDQAHGRGPLDRWVTGIDRPVLVVRRPARATGAAVLVVPGGSYEFLSYDNEGVSQADWLAKRGITTFILMYRLPKEGWADRAVVPLQDAQRAIRVIRGGAIRFGIDPGRVAVLGFSAGGHLGGSLATRFDERVHAPVDAIDRLSARPDLAGLLYPVVSMVAPFSHAGSRDALLGAGASEALRRSASVETRVTANTVPTFLAHAADDGLVPVANSVALYSALLANARPAELHAFDRGGHGFGVRAPANVPASHWPELFHRFGASRGVFT